MPLLEWLDKIDKSLFTIIHAKGAMPSMDWFFLLMRDSKTWIPLYAFMLYWSIRYARKYVIRFALLSGLCTALTDFTSSSLKHLFGRQRPCYAEDIRPILRQLLYCGGNESMPSGHASNHFGLATFWFFSILLMTGKKWYWLWAWAAVICYSQIYVGKHYPFDILAGTCLGMIIGYAMFLLFKAWTKEKHSLS